MAAVAFKRLRLPSRLLLGRQPFVSAAGVQLADTLSLDALVDEEIIPGYDARSYYPANPGDVIAERYRLHAKIGWGSTSTVWLAQDIRRAAWKGKRRKYVAIKLCNCDVPKEELTHELDINAHLSGASQKHRARVILATAIEGHEIESSSKNSHLALVFPLLREPLWLLRKRLTDQDRVTLDILPLIKAYIKILLEGLDYMHSQGKYPDLKLDNIMVTFEDPVTIDEFVQGQVRQPMARKNVETRVVYRCHNDFGPLSSADGIKKMIPQITDFGMAQRGDVAEPLIHPVQPDPFRAPEVLLGTSWSYSADIWNFGAMVWELLAGRSLFRQLNPLNYSAPQHVADMIALIGSAPEALVQREKAMRHWRWSPAVANRDGKLCTSAAQYYGGPFFGDDGKFLHDELIPSQRSFERELPECVVQEDSVGPFLTFMGGMICWMPEDRATAAELPLDPWLELPPKR